MKEQDKYYIPSIEEFYVGFEYEKNDPIVGGYWKKKVIESGIDIRYKEVDIDTKCVRVKYLDQEDIESLGFEFYKEQFSKTLEENGMIFMSDKYNLTLCYYPNLHAITTITKDPSKNAIMLKTTWDNKQISLLNCKNKAELKKIMKMLNILED